jgi:hypothetical protein
VVLGKAELGEVVFFELHLRTVVQGESEALENVHDLLAYDGDRMPVSEWSERATGKRKVERTGLKVFGALLSL